MSRSQRSKIVLSAGLASLLFFFLFIYYPHAHFVYDQNTKSDPVPAAPPPQPSKEIEHVKTPASVRAIYMTSWVAGTPSLREKLLNFVEHSEINSVVIDVKDYSGKISFLSSDESIVKMGSAENRIPAIQNLIAALHQKNIYVIGRITVFQDSFLAKARPDLAVRDTRGGVWHDRKGLAYIDPGSKEYWDYIVHIARVSESVGFDELNFDYIRYPSDGQLRYAAFGLGKGQKKEDVLAHFFAHLDEKVHDLPVATSADLFGLTTWNTDDLNIGQVLEKAAPHFDYIAPMVYPSHYAKGFNGFSNPADHPYEVIHLSMSRAVDRLKAIGEDPSKLRPWIQDFDLGAVYGVPEILKEKKAVDDSGLDSWMAWDPSNNYTKEAYQK